MPMPGDDADWRPYEFKCKPGDPDAPPLLDRARTTTASTG